MILPGYGLEDYSFLTAENVRSFVWLWHINFYSVPEFPELLIAGKEREYFSYFIKHETHDPTAITPDAIDEYVRCYSSPGGIRSMCEIYRATLTTRTRTARPRSPGFRCRCSRWAASTSSAPTTSGRCGRSPTMSAA